MDDELKFFYTNSVETAVSQFDFTLKFMRQGTTNPTQADAVTAATSGGVLAGTRPPVTRDELSVAMSPTHAKALFIALANAVLDYEKNVGRIPFDKTYEDRFEQLQKRIRDQK